MRPPRLELSEKNLYAKGIPRHFFNITIDDFEAKDDITLKAKNIVINYISDMGNTRKDGNGLYFYGSNGTGKTMLASIIVKEAYRCRYTSKRITFLEYLNEYTAIWKAKDVDEREDMEDRFYSYIKDVDFLVLEELGKESSRPDLAASILEDCLRFREERGLCTIFCANFVLDDLIKRYKSSSIESLIKGKAVPVKLVGVDKRVHKNKGVGG